MVRSRVEVDFSVIDTTIRELEARLKNPGQVGAEDKLQVGIDLGTASIVVVVLNQHQAPIALAMEPSNVVKDGLVVDYLGAMQTVKRLVAILERRLGRRLTQAAIAVPSGTGPQNSRTHCHVIEGAGLEVSAVLDEPVAANAVLKIDDGAIVDIGGGTTGLALIENGQVVYTADEPTGGTHVTLVLAGHYRLSVEAAEDLKKQPGGLQERLGVIRPVFQKMATIIAGHLRGKSPQAIYLVGGTCCMAGIEEVFAEELGLPVFKPANPLLVTPLGIALESDAANLLEQDSRSRPSTGETVALKGKHS